MRKIRDRDMMHWDLIKEINSLIVRLEDLQKSTLISQTYMKFIQKDVVKLDQKILYYLQQEAIKTRRIK